MSATTPEQIDAVLPQTQCGLCGYGGCLPYAEGLIYEQAAINLCPPGGVKTLHKLGELLQQDPTPYLADMTQQTKPKTVAVIREAECIGCKKCIQACPVDAIIGGAKQMHTVIASICTGCDLCVPPCPVDCIDMVALADTPSEDDERTKANNARLRFQTRQYRLDRERIVSNAPRIEINIAKKKSYIEEAIARAKAKKDPPPFKKKGLREI